jgi:hypothetical protein
MADGQVGYRFGQSCLAYTGVAQKNDAASAPGAGVVEQGAERRQFCVPTDEHLAP